MLKKWIFVLFMLPFVFSCTVTSNNSSLTDSGTVRYNSTDYKISRLDIKPISLSGDSIQQYLFTLHQNTDKSSDDLIMTNYFHLILCMRSAGPKLKNGTYRISQPDTIKDFSIDPNSVFNPRDMGDKSLSYGFIDLNIVLELNRDTIKLEIDGTLKNQKTIYGKYRGSFYTY